jgi:regulator of PEP synthase PpsR (kinase-PPPase family)
MTMIRAAIVQFANSDVNIIRHKNVRTEPQVESIVNQAAQSRAMIVHTFASQILRNKIQEEAASAGLQSVDLLGPLLRELDRFLGLSSKDEQGLLRIVNDKYFRRIEAIEYTVKHDDGKLYTDLDQADIILLGISRTSKTPLSIFLSHKGWKVANVPLILNSPLPEELFKVDQRKVVGLIIDVETLRRIRRNRLEKFGQSPEGEYASLAHVAKEMEFAESLFEKNRRWPVVDVTEKALEETAAEITKIVCARMGYPTDILY